jgi:hypothetical protein
MEQSMEAAGRAGGQNAALDEERVEPTHGGVTQHTRARRAPTDHENLGS